MREEGTVIAVEGGRARVQMKQGPQCGGCRACAMLGGGTPELDLKPAEPVQVGDRVVVEVSAPSTALGALLVFVLPLLGLVAGVLLGQSWRPFGLAADTSSLALGFGLLAVLLGAATLVDRLVLRRRLAEPAIVQVIHLAGRP